MNNLRVKNNISYLYLVAFSIIFLLISIYYLGFWFTDDAFISFRYAKNMFEGNGLVFNIGEYVQGYTNFAWIILLNIFRLFTINYQTSSILLSMLSLILLAIIFYQFIRKDSFYNTDLYLLLIVSLVVPSNAIFLVWSVGGGLEIVLFSLLIFSSFLLLYTDNQVQLKKVIISAFIISFATLIRPEGFLFFILFVIFLYLFDSDIKKIKKIYYFVLIYLIIIIPYLIWCYYYYDSLLPNTFYAKVNFSITHIINGIRYFYRFFMTVPFYTLFLITGFFYWKNLQLISKLSYFTFFVYVVYIIMIGGDFMFANRFFVPVLPFMLIIFFDTLKLNFMHLKNNKPVMMGILISVIIYNLLSVSNFYKNDINNYFLIGNGEKLSKYLNSKYPKNYIIASSAIGSLGYFSDMKILDVLGLTNKEIAKSITPANTEITGHNRSNVEYIKYIKPDIIIFGEPLGSELPVRIAEKDIYSSDFFKTEYMFKEENIDSSTLIRYYLKKGSFK